MFTTKIKNFLVGLAILALAIFFDRFLRRRQMERHAKQAWSYFFIAFFALGTILLLGMMCGCAKPVTAPMPVEYTPPVESEARFYIAYVDSQGAAGITSCAQDGLPLVTLEKWLIGSSDLMLLEAHEFTHVRDMVRYGKCVDYMHRFQTDEKFRLHAEAKAYCKQLQVGALVLGWNVEEELDKFAQWLATAPSYQIHSSFGEVKEYIRKTCKESS